MCSMKSCKGSDCKKGQWEDRLTIDYSGSLRVRRGNYLEGVLVKVTGLPDSIKFVLDSAARNHDCNEIRKITEEITRFDCEEHACP